MRTRPTRGGHSIRLFSAKKVSVKKVSVKKLTAAAAVLSLIGLIGAGPAAAAWDWSTSEQVLLTGMDVVIVRPLSAVRVGVGAVLMVPASILASPACIVKLFAREDCRPVYEAPYEVLVGEPAEYAFNRKMGEL